MSTENDESQTQDGDEGKKTSLTTIVLGVILAVSVLGLAYSLNSNSKLKDEVKSLQEQVQRQDSLLQKNNEELKAAAEDAQRNLKKAQDQADRSTRKQAKPSHKKGKGKKK